MNLNIVELLKKYKKDLHDFPPLEISNQQKLFHGSQDFFSHVHWMINFILENPNDFNDQKLNRWLGWIQGILCFGSIKSLKTLRDESRNL